MLEILEYEFFQRALLASFIVGGMASYFAVFIVQRKMSFVGNGLAHASFGGVALGLLLGLQPIAIAAPFTVLVALLFVWLLRNSKLEADSIIGVLFSLSMALGVIFLSLRTTYSQDAMSLLFGSILTISAEDITWSLALFFVFILSLPLWRRWAISTFDQEFARVEKKSAAWDDYLLSSLVALSVVLAIKVFGIILLSAFLVIPAASARLISRRFFSMTLLSVALGIGSSLSGLVLSYYADLPSGASVIVAMCAVFGICLALSKIYSPR